MRLHHDLDIGSRSSLSLTKGLFLSCFSALELGVFLAIADWYWFLELLLKIDAETCHSFGVLKKALLGQRLEKT